LLELGCRRWQGPAADRVPPHRHPEDHLALPDHQQQHPAPRPHLIHVGYAKSGSSFLRRWFAEHPQIAYRPGHFGGIAGFAELARGTAAIRLRVTSSEILASPVLESGAAEPGAYRAVQAAICDNLAELFPGGHILIVTRGFRSMIMSSYSQYVRSGGTNSLEKLVGDAQAENPWHYDALIGLYRQRFGEDRVTVLPWELLRDDPSQFVARIEARFGLEGHPPSPQRVNRSLSPSEMRWYPRLAAAVARAPVGSRLRGQLARRVARMSHNNSLAGAVRLLQRVAPAPPVSLEALPATVLEGFRGKARSLAAEPLFAPYAADYLNDGPA
jgi:hypothetical protein